MIFEVLPLYGNDITVDNESFSPKLLCWQKHTHKPTARLEIVKIRRHYFLGNVLEKNKQSEKSEKYVETIGAWLHGL